MYEAKRLTAINGAIVSRFITSIFRAVLSGKNPK